jgi:hypothetical protein
MDDRLRMLRVTGAVGAALAVVAVFVAWSVLAHNAASTGERAGSTAGVKPAEGTSPTADATPTPGPSGTATGSPGAARPPGAVPGGVDGAAAGPAVPARVAGVAYRRQGWLCVAAEDGGGERRVIVSDSGVFALSPDAATIAWVDDGERTLVIVDVATARVVVVGPAEQDRPSWAPDSSWLAYTAPGSHVRRVARDGAGGITLFTGSLPAVASDGTAVVGSAVSGGPGIVVWRSGAPSRIGAQAPVSGLACDGSRVFYGTAPAGSGNASLNAVGLDGRGGVVLAGTPASTRMIAVCDLRLSPDRARIAYAECGDDGYSRTFAVPVTGGKAVAFSARRDTYPLDWAADGARLLFIEGNAFQGEATAMLAAAADGSSRSRLLEGAGR